MSYSRLLKRGSVYYFRAKVPVDLFDHYAPKTEIKFSLKTRDRRDAIRLVHIESARLDEEFAQIRQRRNAEPITELSVADIQALANAWLSHLLEEDEELRAEGLSDPEFDKYQVTLDMVDEGAVSYVQGVTDGMLAIEALHKKERGVPFEFCKLHEGDKGKPVRHPAYQTKMIVTAWEKAGRSMDTLAVDMMLSFLSSQYGCTRQGAH